MPDPEVAEPLSLAVRPLMSLVGTILKPARRLYQERVAGLVPVGGQSPPLELNRFFDATLARLSAGNIEDSWWRNLLDRVGHAYVVPEVFKRDDLQAWLKDDQVQADFKALAGACIVEAPDAPEIRSRLQERYTAITKQAGYLTDEPIEVVVAILLAAFVADLGPVEERLAWLTLESDRQTRAEIQRVNRTLESLGPDRLVQEVYTQRASEELTRIQKLRAWDLVQAREQVRQLLERVQNGDLRHADRKVLSVVLHWAARLHAGQPEHLDAAKSFRDQLQQLDPAADTRILDALILETDGDGDGALRLLRDGDDPDARSVFFSLLHKVRGQATALKWFDDQEGRQDPRFLTGLGWFRVALALAEAGRWEEAASYLAGTREHVEEWPELLFLEGVVNAALLLPSELRRHALDMNLLHPEVHTIEGPDADRHRERTTLCFEQAEKKMEVLFPKRASGAQQWLLWLRLINPDLAVKQTATEEVGEQMQNPEQAVFLLPIARAFGIPFDSERLWGYLEKRARLGGLEDHELQARFMLAEMTLEPAEFIAYLDQEELLLRRVIPTDVLSGLKIEALVGDEQTAKARSLLEERREDFEKNDGQRLEALIEAHAGKDPRPRLEGLYETSHSLFDLQNLVRHLHSVRDWSALRPRLEDLFKLERNLQNALRLVHCLQSDPESDEADILGFLEANQDLVDRNPDLISVKAWALFRAGRLVEVRMLNDRLLSERDHSSDLQLDINLALQSGAWERFSTIVEREWPKLEEHGPETLIQLASLAAEADATASRAVELIKLAVDKGGGDPHLLTAAITLSYRLGREGEQVGEWLSRAMALSSDEGPIRAFDTRTLVEEWMPADRERRRAIEEKWLHGELPLHMVSTGLNVPLSYLLIGLPRSNATMQDGRCRTIIPIISGVRQPVSIQPEWTIGLDVTSLMVLANLGLLRQVIESFGRVVLAPDTMLLMLNERNRVRFHQPSRVKKAVEILTLIGIGKLQPAEPLPSPTQWLSEEIGIDLAQLLQSAQETQGRVVHPRPIHKLRSFLDEEAQLRDYDSLVLSTVALERLMYQRGNLDEPTHQAASRYLLSQDRGTNTDVEESVLERPLYLDDLAVGYLQSAGLLSAMVNFGLDLRVHPSLRQEQSDLIATNREGEKLAEAIEEIRLMLRDALQAGKAWFLPRHNPTKEEESLVGAAPTLGQFLQDVGSCNALSIDDRFVNKVGAFSDRRGKAVSVLCILDILRYLETQGVLSLEERQNALHKLRQSGFAFVPVEPEELKRLLTAVQWKQDGTFIESAELRTIRQTVGRIRSLGLLRQPSENSLLGALRYTCIWVISQLWLDDGLTVERAALLTDWVWHHVAPSPLDWYEGRQGDAFILYISLLLQPLPVIPEERREAFLEWMESRVLEPLLPANSEILNRLAILAGRQIEEWSEKIASETQEGSGN